MKKQTIYIFLPLLIAMLLSGCHPIGAKSGNVSFIYAATAILSIMLLIGYCCLIKQKNVWFILLFSSVPIVNIGYFCLSISKTLEEALLANRISYLGSVILPMAILMIIFDVANLNYKTWFPILLVVVGFIVFLIAASPGYLTIYYKEVILENIGGATTLKKTYGPWHSLYLVYLLSYFGGMIGAISYAIVKKKIDSIIQAVILAATVFVNIGVWLIEQLVKIDFEILAISYIISELFLLGLNIIISENEKLKEQVKHNQYPQLTSIPTAVTQDQPEPQFVSKAPENSFKAPVSEPLPEQFTIGLKELTRTERIIYDYYIEGKTTKEILLLLDIKENTLKFHNKNIYSKLGVSSRKQLVEIHKKNAIT